MEKIVHVSIKATLYQGSNGFANLKLYFPGKSWVIPYLAMEQFNYWADYLILKMEEQYILMLFCSRKQAKLIDSIFKIKK
jgi:hypothetical protein